MTLLIVGSFIVIVAQKERNSQERTSQESNIQERNRQERQRNEIQNQRRTGLGQMLFIHNIFTFLIFKIKLMLSLF